MMKIPHCWATQRHCRENRFTTTANVKSAPGRSPSEGVHLFGKLAEQDVLGGIGEDQHHVDVPWPQLHQIAGVGDVG